eukprot:471430-Alexandrium_andersonii.AAC.1
MPLPLLACLCFAFRQQLGLMPLPLLACPCPAFRLLMLCAGVGGSLRRADRFGLGGCTAFRRMLRASAVLMLLLLLMPLPL